MNVKDQSITRRVLVLSFAVEGYDPKLRPTRRVDVLISKPKGDLTGEAIKQAMQEMLRRPVLKYKEGNKSYPIQSIIGARWSIEAEDIVEM